MLQNEKTFKIVGVSFFLGKGNIQTFLQIPSQKIRCKISETAFSRTVSVYSYNFIQDQVLSILKKVNSYHSYIKDEII